GRGTPIAGDLFSLAPRCRPSEPEPREGTTRIQLFFMCDEDLLMAPPRPTFRLVPSAQNPVEAALTELLKGPTAAERKAGFTSWFSDQTAGMLRSVRLTPQGRAVVDFAAALPRTIPNASTSAGSMALRMELAHTLFQFPEVKEIEPLVDGRCEVFGAWMQTDCLVIKRP
ncbi:MAG TPA: GerMN domain-containing protein, partial [Symbiobacteriaceae bacterium]|nr:GerMN domain-containing protein [Symbiobacteriaceae bacterium]